MLKRILVIINFSVIVVFGVKFSLSDMNTANKDNNESAIRSIKILENQSYVEDVVLVTLNSDISGFDIDHSDTIFSDFRVGDIRHINKVSDNSRKFIDEHNYKQIYEIKLNSSQSKNLQKTINEIYEYPGVYYVEPSYTFEVEQDSNDPMFVVGDLWGLNGTNGINAPGAWDITTGSSDVRVGIIDTGILEHEDLIGNLVSGWSTYSDSDITNNDVNGHGTHVAGTIGGVGNNNIGIVGVNWNVSLVPIQANDGSSDFFTTPDLVEAITYATNLWGSENQIDILNFSIGGYGISITIREEVRNFPGLFVWAAGNEAFNIDTRVSNNGTFDLPNIISVGASTSTGQRWSQSNYSLNDTNVNIYAPGHDIMSTVPSWRNWSWESWRYYKSYSGTSMAAPHVTGVAALMLSINPNLTAEQIKNIIIDNSDDLIITIPNGTGGMVTQVVRRLNAYEAVKKVVGFNTRILSDNTIEIIDVIGSEVSGIIEIPNFWRNRIVTSIGNSAFSGENQLTKITIPSTVTHIGADAFKNTNNAPIYLDNRIVAPSTFNINWNSSVNPVYLDGILCTHSNTTLTSAGLTQHGHLCNDCRTFISKSNHNHNQNYTPYGTAPSGIAVHLSSCACGSSVVTPCISRIPHEPGDTVTCWYCGQVFSNPIMYTITLTNGEVFGSNIPFTYEMYKNLSDDLGLNYSYNDYALEVANSEIYHAENYYNKNMLQYNIHDHDCYDCFNNCIDCDTNPYSCNDCFDNCTDCYISSYDCFNCDINNNYVERKELLFIINNRKKYELN